MPKISALPAATSVNPADLVAIVQSGTTKRAAASLIGTTARTAAEIAVAVTPVDYTYEPGHVLRYGTNTTPGTTSMTAAVQAAFTVAAQAGIPAELGSETYNCASAKLTCNCSVNGDGATIKGYIESAASDITWRGFTVESTQTTYGIYLHGQSGTRYADIWLDAVNITFGAGATPASSRLGLNATYIDRLKITNSHIQYGVQLTSVANYTVTGNWLDGDNYQNVNELLHASLRSYGIIANNTFTNSLDNFLDLYSSGERTVISGNRFISCKTRLGAAVEIKVTLTDTDNTSSDANGWVEQIILDGNLFQDIIAYTGQFTEAISVYYLDSRAAPSFDWADVPRNLIISNNIFDGFNGTDHGANVYACIYLNTVAAALITGNVFCNQNLGASSIYVSSCLWLEKVRDVVVSHNKFSMDGGCGITIHGESTDLTISDNHFTDDLTPSFELAYGIYIAKYGSRPAVTLTDAKITGNTINATSYGMYMNLTGGSTLADCLIADNQVLQGSLLQDVSRCRITNNHFECTASGDSALSVGASSVISEHCVISGNTFKTDVGTPKTGLYVERLRGSTIKDNFSQTTTYGMRFVGTSSAGELEYLNIKDNFSVSQTQTNFPEYTNMHATDTGYLQAANNQKIT